MSEGGGEVVIVVTVAGTPVARGCCWRACSAAEPLRLARRHERAGAGAEQLLVVWLDWSAASCIGMGEGERERDAPGDDGARLDELDDGRLCGSDELKWRLSARMELPSKLSLIGAVGVDLLLREKSSGPVEGAPAWLLTRYCAHYGFAQCAGDVFG